MKTKATKRVQGEKWSELSIKSRLTLISASAAFLLGWIIVICGLFMPPLGEISNSVLVVLGEGLVYAASALGITLYLKDETLTMQRRIAQEMNRMNNNDKDEDEEK